MKVDGYGNIKSVASSKKRSGVAQAGGFSELLDSSIADDAASSSIHDVSSPTQISGLLALQEVSDDDFSRKKNIQHGENIINSLENLRRGLLLGNLPIHILRDIEQKIAAKRVGFNDQKLTAILDEIELRAAVEIAKLEMAIPK